MKSSFRLLAQYLVSFVFCLLSFQLMACSCLGTTYLCTLIENEDELDRVIFKGRTLEIVEHPELIHSLFVEVTEIFYGEDILTDTIELLGAENMQSACRIPLYNVELDKEYYFAFHRESSGSFGDVEWGPLNSSHWSGTPNLCYSGIMPIVDGKVIGQMTSSMTSYPAEFFEQDLIDCNFRQELVDAYACEDFSFSPNPLRSDRLLQFHTPNMGSVRSIRLYSVSGILLYENYYPSIHRVFRLPIFNESIIIAEVYCGEERFVQKLFYSPN